MGYDFIRFPNICSIAVCCIDFMTIWGKLLQLPDIQTQLRDSEIVDECRSILANHGEAVKLDILNQSIPSKCIIM